MEKIPKTYSVRIMLGHLPLRKAAEVLRRIDEECNTAENWKKGDALFRQFVDVQFYTDLPEIVEATKKIVKSVVPEAELEVDEVIL